VDAVEPSAAVDDVVAAATLEALEAAVQLQAAAGQGVVEIGATHMGDVPERVCASEAVQADPGGEVDVDCARVVEIADAIVFVREIDRRAGRVECDRVAGDGVVARATVE
jgi:hypothetical protein